MRATQVALFLLLVACVKPAVQECAAQKSIPARIGGLGDEAFWMGNRIAGALYVLKGDAYVRVSVGGPSDKASQTRARMLAKKAITRL